MISFIGLTGQTPGKMLVGLKVVDSGGKPPGIERAALREVVGKFLSGIFFFLGFFWAEWDDRKQGWHNKVAGTFVVKVNRGGDEGANAMS